MRNLVILGSTGSIGTQALNVVRGLNQNDDFPVKVVALAAFSNVELIETQAREFKPELVCLYDEKSALELQTKLSDTNIRVVSGMDGLCEAATINQADIVLNSVVGMIGLKPTLEAIYAGKDIALANKETLVAGGELVMNAVKEHGVNIYPVDSEHSAIFQCLEGCNDKKELKKLIITASGGAFLGKTYDELKTVKPSDALNHPNWDMGAKITIDTSTMMNKGLEVIEASWLFDMPAEKIDVVVQRESIIHSLVEYEDNSVIAQLGLPDMQIAIQYAITYPNRYPSPAGELNLAEIAKLTFYEPDYKTFKCLSVCVDALKQGGLVPAAVNGANEEAVKLFLEGKIAFTDIGNLVEEAGKRQEAKSAQSLEDILYADKCARDFVNNNYS